ncbi:thioredoxin-related transmembrane protein 1 [Trichonephila clavata]|uniref:Thioredoxin-related transmembrane protein 1 n=1 Tax=Trichonephila clavata TaxID=2740835 RepID=A0A8X6HW96_TRICU|nr:thioredoxin-related transmembrane protein 1 [Trichonephila clavata]
MFSFRFFHYILLSCVIIPQAVLSKGQLKSLNEDTWSEMLTGEWMVEFYAPWCPACQQLQPLWKEFGEWSDDLGIKVGSVDVTLNPGLSGRFMIAALPTIFHVKDGEFRQYRGARDKDSFISFIEEKKWINIDPVPSWKSPQSYQMSTVSAFFRLSMLLRSTHNTLIQDYGIPYWGSYIIFGLLTILIGAFLGLLVVCIIDFFCPSRTSYQPLQRNANTDDAALGKKDESEGEYEGEDVIKEDIGDAEVRRRKEPKSPK